MLNYIMLIYYTTKTKTYASTGLRNKKQYCELRYCLIDT